MKNLLLGLFLTILAASAVNAQLISVNPPIPTADQGATLTLNTVGTGLEGYTGDVYAHTGVTVNGNQWSNVIGDWGNNDNQPQLAKIGTELYKLEITPSIRDFYGVSGSGLITEMSFVFRSADGNQQTSPDFFIDVFESGLAVKISLPEERPLIVEENDIIHVEGFTNEADSTFLLVDGQQVFADTGSTFYYDITAENSGKTWIKAIATDGIESVADSIYYIVIHEPVIEDLPDGIIDGINYTSDVTATLCLTAPEKEYIFVIGDFNDWQMDEEYQMKITPDGENFWLEIEGLEPGKEYVFQYFIDGSIRIGDPYADKVSDPWNDEWISSTTYPNLIEYPDGKTTGIATVLQTDQQPYEWQIDNFENPATTDLVIYELLVRDFIEEHDFETLIDYLGYLDSLGVNVIELMPNSEFEGNSSWGYNPNYYFAPDKYYGPKNTFKAFVDECHAMGIAVFMDLVLNHSYGTNAMAMMYWNSESNRPAANNPWFNEVSNFENPEAQWGNDFNHESIYTQKLVDSINSYWINEYHIDGFRFDFTKGFGNNFKSIDNDSWGSNYDADRIALLKRMADKIWEQKPDAAVIFEHLSVNTEEKVLANYGILLWGNLNYNYNQATMGYDDSNFEWISYKERGWNDPNVVGYMESHDEERLMFKNLEYGASLGDYSVKDLGIALKRQELAANFFFTIPGPKMIWQFGERGYDVSIEYNGRVGEKPPKWEYVDDWRRKNLFYVYSALIDLKKNKDVFETDDFSLSLSTSMKKIRLNSSEMNVVVLGNFDLEEKSIVPQFQSTGTWYEYWTGDSITVTDVNATISLEAGEYRLYTSTKLSKPGYVGVDNIETTKSTVILYPNPVFDLLTITNTSNVEQVNIYNLMGSIVQSKQSNFGEYIEMDTQKLTPGYYIVKLVTNSGNSISKKFIKK